jgi:hypothetical protein
MMIEIKNVSVQDYHVLLFPGNVIIIFYY